MSEDFLNVDPLHVCSMFVLICINCLLIPKHKPGNFVIQTLCDNDGQHRAKTCLRAYVDIKDPDQPVHP